MPPDVGEWFIQKGEDLPSRRQKPKVSTSQPPETIVISSEEDEAQPPKDSNYKAPKPHTSLLGSPSSNSARRGKMIIPNSYTKRRRITSSDEDNVQHAKPNVSISQPPEAIVISSDEDEAQPPKASSHKAPQPQTSTRRGKSTNPNSYTKRRRIASSDEEDVQPAEASSSRTALPQSLLSGDPKSDEKAHPVKSTALMLGDRDKVQSAKAPIVQAPTSNRQDGNLPRNSTKVVSKAQPPLVKAVRDDDSDAAKESQTAPSSPDDTDDSEDELPDVVMRRKRIPRSIEGSDSTSRIRGWQILYEAVSSFDGTNDSEDELPDVVMRRKRIPRTIEGSNSATLNDNDTATRTLPPSASRIRSPNPWQDDAQSHACQSILSEAVSKSVRSAKVNRQLLPKSYRWIDYADDLTSEEWGKIAAGARVTKARQRFIEERQDITSLSHISREDADALTQPRRSCDLPSGPGVYMEGVVDLKDEANPRLAAVFGMARSFYNRRATYNSNWNARNPTGRGSPRVPFDERRGDLVRTFTPLLWFLPDYDWRKVIGKPDDWEAPGISLLADILDISHDRALLTITTLLAEMACVSIHKADTNSNHLANVPHRLVWNKSPGGDYPYLDSLLSGKKAAYAELTPESKYDPEDFKLQPADIHWFQEKVIPIFTHGNRTFCIRDSVWVLWVSGDLCHICGVDEGTISFVFPVSIEICNLYGIASNNIFGRAFHLPDEEDEPTTPSGLEVMYGNAYGRRPAMEVTIDANIPFVKEAFIYELRTGRLVRGPEAFRPLTWPMKRGAESFVSLVLELASEDQRERYNTAATGEGNGAEGLRYLAKVPRLYYQVGFVLGELTYLWQVCGNQGQLERNITTTVKLMEMVAVHNELQATANDQTEAES